LYGSRNADLNIPIGKEKFCGLEELGICAEVSEKKKLTRSFHFVCSL